MSEEESAPLLDFLNRHSQRPEFQIRFRWTKGALAFWDDRSTHHLAVNDYAGYRRVMDRITIAGDKPSSLTGLPGQFYEKTRGEKISARSAIARDETAPPPRRPGLQGSDAGCDALGPKGDRGAMAYIEDTPVELRLHDVRLSPRRIIPA